MDRISLLGLLSAASAISGAICFVGAGNVTWAGDYAVFLILIAGGLGVWAIVETYKPKQ